MKANQRVKVWVVVLIGSGILLFAHLVNALHYQTPRYLQVTLQSAGTVDAISSWTPEFWSFNSSGDPLANGNAVPQIFLYDHKERVLAGRYGIKQVTCGSGAVHPSLAFMGPRGQRSPGWIAFEADGMLCADPRHNCDLLANPTAGPQIFAYDDASGQIHQLTRCPTGCRRPNLSGNGKFIVFETADQLTAGGGLGTVTELYQGDLRKLGPFCPQFPCSLATVDNRLRRLTTGGGERASQSFNGRRVAFESTGDNINNGANPGVRHVYFLDAKTMALTQLSTATALEDAEPSLSGSGRAIAFTMQVPPPPPLSAPVRQIFFGRINSKGAVRLTQLTRGLSDSVAPSIDPAGRRVAFISGADLRGLGLPGNQLYLYDRRRHNLEQLTAGPNGVLAPDTTTGVFVGFSSADDLTANGNTTPQFFIINFFPYAPSAFESPFPGTPVPPGTPSPTVTPTPVAGVPANIGLALLAQQAADNGDNALTTVLAVTVGDVFGNAVPDGMPVHMSVGPPTVGAVVSDAATNADPVCDVSRFVQKTGLQIINQPGTAHVCLTYPGAQALTERTIIATAGPMRCVGGSMPDAPCSNDGECLPIRICSTQITKVCSFDQECPGGGLCELHTATCEPTARAEGLFLLPLAVSECTADGQPCTDFNPCTTGDVCAGGSPDLACRGGANDGLSCSVDSQCADLYACIGGSNHGNPCRDGFDCPPGPDGPGACVLRSATLGCKLRNPPACQPGTPLVCPDDGNACTVDQCNFFTGRCGMPMECADDGNPCTDDICNALDGTCGVANALPCEDGNPCTYNDTCTAGACVSGPEIVCPDDLNSCTIDICDPTTGTCGVRFEPCGCSAP